MQQDYLERTLRNLALLLARLLKMKESGDETAVRAQIALACEVNLGLNFDEIVTTDDLSNVVAHIETFQANQIREAEMIFDFLVEHQLDDMSLENLRVCQLQLQVSKMKINKTLDFLTIQNIKKIYKNLQNPTKSVPISLQKTLEKSNIF
ncbi:MAG: hypothetical protein RL757_1875 [Bacteroidota bacterium]|jgi:hypothetical protein